MRKILSFLQPLDFYFLGGVLGVRDFFLTIFIMFLYRRCYDSNISSNFKCVEINFCEG